MHVQVEPRVIQGVRERAGMPLEVAAQRLKVEQGVLQQWERTKSSISVSKLRELARIYKHSWGVFLLKELPPKYPQPKNFRRLFGDTSDFSSATIHAFTLARRILEYANELGGSRKGELIDHLGTASLSDNPADLALAVRELLNISLDTQSRWRDKYAAKASWVEAIESRGIYVAEMDMPKNEARGFSMTHANNGIIVVSKEDKPYPRIFSLFHELCHLLLGEAGVCDMAETHSSNRLVERTEVFCNHFAASLLVPEAVLRKEPLVMQGKAQGNFPDDLVLAISRRFNVSAAVILRRLLTLGYIGNNEYKVRFEKAQQGFAELEKNGTPKKKIIPSYGKKILNQNSRAFTADVFNAYRANKITFRDIGGYLGIKVKSIPLVEHALFG